MLCFFVLRFLTGLIPLILLNLGSISTAEGFVDTSYMSTFFFHRSNIWGVSTAATKYARTKSINTIKNNCSRLYFLKNNSSLSKDSSMEYSFMTSPRKDIVQPNYMGEVKKTMMRWYRSSTTKKRMKQEIKGGQNHGSNAALQNPEKKNDGPKLNEEEKNTPPSFSSSFFDSVDEKMEELRENEQTPPSFSSSFFDSVDERMEELRQQKDNEDIAFSSSSNMRRSEKNEDSFLELSSNSNDVKTTSNNPDSMFHRAAFDAYKETMLDIINSTRFRRKKTQEDIDIISTYLFNDQQVAPITLPTLFQQINSISSEETVESSSNSFQQSELTKKSFENELNTQQEKFMMATNFTPSQHQHIVTALSSLAEMCAKKSLPHLSIAWHKVKEIGAVPRANIMNTYLYVVSNANIVDNLSANHELIGEVATFHDILFQPNEKSITLRIKNKVEQGDIAGAESLLSVPIHSKEESVHKLRTFFPILKTCCEKGDCSSALRLFTKMKNSPGVILEPETHVLVIGTLAEHGYFERNARHIDGAFDLGYEADSGPALFDMLAQEMADDVLEITPASVKKLSTSFTSSTINNDDDQSLNDRDEDYGIDRLLRVLPSLKDVPVNNEIATDDELVLSRVEINKKTAVCPRTGATLRLIMLDKEQKREFHDGLLRLASEQHQSFISNHKKSNAAPKDEDYAAKKLMDFADWLDSREGEPFTAIVDGANVAYFGQNFQMGGFNYNQIQFIVDALEAMNEKVLVTVPHKYTNRAYYASTGTGRTRALFSKEDIEIMNNLTETGRLYKVPSRCLDDYYWMLASVSNQTVSSKGCELTVPAAAQGNNGKDDHKQQQWPGLRPMLVSNDQMRDHKMELLAPRLFRRWTSSHMVNYNFTAFFNDECIDNEIEFSTPDFFSREIQGNPTESGMTAWHFPVSDWDPNERFCIRLPRR